MKDQFDKYREFFSENRLFRKLKQYARNAGIKTVYTVLLLFYAYRRKETPAWAKRIILGAIGYFISPIDAIPDLTPLIGYTDDLSILSFGLVTIACFINKEVKVKAKTKLKDWFGAYDEEELADIDKQL